MVDWKRVRSLFPAVERRVYLNTAGGGPISRPAGEAGRRYYEQSVEDGDVHWDEWLEEVERVRGRLAAFVGAEPRNVAFTANCSAALNFAAHMLRDRGPALAVDHEFPSCSLPWLQLGHEVRFVETDADGVPRIELLEGVVEGVVTAKAMRSTEAAGILATSFVQFQRGARLDLGALGRLCREHDMALVVDGTQGVGAFPVDVGAAGVDFLAFSGYKWLNAGYGVGALVVSDRFLEAERFPAVGWRSARRPYDLVWDRLDLDDRAAALEMGHPPFAGIFALGAALELVEEIGIEAIRDRILDLVGYLHERLDECGLPLLSTRDPEHVSGIAVVGVEEPQRVVAALAERGVVVSARGAGIRASAHCYNDRGDIDRLVEALVEVHR